jgi:3-oxoacyl-[acyl-carrier protein] reductase
LERVVAEIARTGGEVHAVIADVTEEEPATAAMRGAIEKFGALDILVNNVGGGRNGRIWEITPEDWDYVLKLNLRSVFLCTRVAAPHMIQRGSGRIICLSSGAREGTPWWALDSGAVPRITVDWDTSQADDFRTRGVPWSSIKVPPPGCRRSMKRA